MSSNEKISTNVEEVEPVEWSAEEEIKLFFALEGLKPVGVNKHFYMACIAERLSKSLNRDVPAEAIWAHLRILYNLDMLDELEPLPFPNEQIDFALPDTEYSSLLSKKHSENEHLSEESDSSVIPTNKAELPPPPIIAVITANTSKDKVVASKTATLTQITEFEKKILAKLEAAKRTPKRTRGSMSLESNSPSTTPPPMQNQKRRRI